MTKMTFGEQIPPPYSASFYNCHLTTHTFLFFTSTVWILSPISNRQKVPKDGFQWGRISHEPAKQEEEEVSSLEHLTAIVQSPKMEEGNFANWCVVF